MWRSQLLTYGRPRRVVYTDSVLHPPGPATAASAQAPASPARRWATPLLLAAVSLIGIVVCIRPLFGTFIPAYAGSEFVSHVALVAAARDTWRTTWALPLSSDTIHAGIEYPYFIFGNQAFYWLASLVGIVARAPSYIGAGLTLAGSFALGVVGMYLLARRGGLGPEVSVGLGFLYAAGPYPSVNLFIRNAFPEYTAWQALPVLLVGLQQATWPRAGPRGVLVGALALAAPFYLHKLLAPHLALTLGLLALNFAPRPFHPLTLGRLGLAGGLGILFSAPAWLAAMRGLDSTTLGLLGGAQAPGVLHTSAANLFWPWAINSLPSGPSFDFWEGRFALQIGVVPLFGALAAVWTLVTRPGLFAAGRLGVPLLLMAANALLVVDVSAWNLAPGPLKYVQFAYRLIGVAHFLGFVLLVVAVGTPRHELGRLVPERGRRLAAAAALVLAGVSASTYWHDPPPLERASADIRPADLLGLDMSAFWPKTTRGSLVTTPAIDTGGNLLAPPRPIAVPTAVPSLILSATVPPALLETGPELTIRLYGFARRAPEASLVQLSNLIVEVANAEATVAPIAALSRAAAGDGPTDGLDLPRVPWTVTRLAEATVTSPGGGAVRLSTPLDGRFDAIALECSRAILTPPPAGTTTPGGRCLTVEYLAAPNNGRQFVVPRDVPAERRTRAGFGTVRIDGRALPRGHYVLPTFNYAFLRLTASDGSDVPTYDFDRRPAFRHTGDRSYTMSYDLRPELLALAAGLAIFGVYAGASAWSRRSRRGVDTKTP